MSKFIKAWEILGSKVAYEDGKGNIIIQSEGTPAWRNNNPGNVGAGSFANRHGAIGSSQGHAIFPDIKTAEVAKDALLKNNYLDKTILEAFTEKYSPKGQQNPNASNYADFISKRVKAPLDTKIGSLTSEQYELLKSGINIFEHSASGETTRVPAGTLDNERLQAEWALQQPVEILKDENIKRLVASRDYRDPAAPLHDKIHDVVQKWHQHRYGTEPQTDATGRPISPEPAPLQNQKPETAKKPQLKADKQSGQGGGEVHVDAYDREGGREHVHAHTRSRPHRSGAGNKGK